MKISSVKEFLLGGNKGLKYLKLLIVGGIVFLLWFLFKPQPKSPPPSPVSAPTPGNKTNAYSPVEEKTYQTVSYYITTSQELLNKARELAEKTSVGENDSKTGIEKTAKEATSETITRTIAEAIAGSENLPRQQTPEEKQKIIELINHALDIINQGIAVYPLDDRVFAQRAVIYQAITPILPEAKNFAIQDLKEAIKLNNQNPNHHLRLANLYLTGGDFEGAALAFYNAHQLAPTDLQTLYSLADTLEKGGQLTKAALWFEKLLGLLPSNDGNKEKIRQRLAALKEAINKTNLKYLTSPGELAVPAASSKEKEIIGTQELPLEQAALASKIIIVSEKEINSISQTSAEISLNALSGEGAIPAGKTEITIYNNNVETTSKIVVVPLGGDFKNRVLFVSAKKVCDVAEKNCGWFKVGIDSVPKSEIKFKWWIIK